MAFVGFGVPDRASGEQLEKAVAYTRNAAGRIETVTDVEGTTRYSYFEDGEIAEVVHPDGSRDIFDHDEIIAARRVATRLASEEKQSRGTRGRSSLSASANRFTFTGHYFDRETGLYYAGARYYDPQTGRFITQDSATGNISAPPSLHRYLYANANPMRYVDPTGHESVSQWLFGHGEDSYAGAFGKAVAYNTWNLVSFGTLGRQDKLVEQFEGGGITDEQYGTRTKINAASGVVIAGAAVATGGVAAGLAGAGASAAGLTATEATIAAGFAGGGFGVLGAQTASDLVELSGTKSKTIGDIRTSDYLLAFGLGAVTGPGVAAIGNPSIPGLAGLDNPATAALASGLQATGGAAYSAGAATFRASVQPMTAIEGSGGMAVMVPSIGSPAEWSVARGMVGQASPGDPGFIGPLQPHERPILMPGQRPYNEARGGAVPGYEEHHLDPPYGRNDPGYRTGPTIRVRNDNIGGRVPDGENFHTGKGSFHGALDQYIAEHGYTRAQWSALPAEQRTILLRRFWASFGIPF